ncbi:hypothetical protein FACS1894133_2870 [Clostridia bacterium]|nr:hypothetical protein FACS1894133_2870 [Clostridia bacterium]
MNFAEGVLEQLLSNAPERRFPERRFPERRFPELPGLFDYDLAVIKAGGADCPVGFAGDTDDMRGSDGFMVVGIDEAGRGPLAGDVYAAAVAFPSYDGLAEALPLLNDSKKMSEAARERLVPLIKSHSVWAVGVATVAEIDEHNILRATFLAMNRAYAALPLDNQVKAPHCILIDGNRRPDMATAAGVTVMTVVKGDGRSAAIAAASVIAKTERDAYMLRLAEQYPQYRFDKHKGYGTKLHYEMIAKYGITPVHRRTFLRTGS